MRVAYVCADPGVPVFGQKGSSVHVQAILQAFVERGARVDLFASRFDSPAPPGLTTVRQHALPGLPRGDVAARERAALAVNQDLVARLIEHGPFDLIYERYSLWSEAAILYAEAHGLPSLLEVNAPLIDEQAQHRVLVHRVEAERVAMTVFGAATALLAVSDGVASYLDGFPVTRGRVHVLPNGVDPERFRPEPDAGLPRTDGTVTVGFVGTLKPWHGLMVLVDAFTLLHRTRPHTRLLIVGDGPERAGLVSALEQRGLASASRLTGSVAPAAVPELVAAMDIAVAPYPSLEDFYFSPLKVYEYMAAARPVITSRIGQLASLLDDGVTGLLCPPGDATALAAALTRLTDDSALRTQLGQAARARILRQHTWTATLERALALVGHTVGV